jgi:predicted transposase/invertase (TIGR01784 family)
MVKSIMEEAKKEGKREGKLEGKLEAYKEMAIRLLKQGYDIAAISNITGLSRTEIESLRNGC